MPPIHPPHRLSTTLLAMLLGAVLSACAPTTRVILLPQANGTPSAVAVSTTRGEQVIDQPYQVANVGARGALSVDTTTAEKVREAYPRLIAMQPPPPERFVLEFEPATPQLTPESQAQLDHVVARAKARPGGEIVVTGHTDRQGPLEANDALSLERAQAIREQLIERGLRAELIEAVGRGEREPLVPTDDEVAEPANRRAVIDVR